MKGSAVVGVLAVAIGIMSGLLIANSVRSPEDRQSPWPYVMGIVMLAIVAMGAVTL